MEKERNKTYSTLVKLIIARIWDSFQLSRYQQHIEPAQWPDWVKELAQSGLPENTAWLNKHFLNSCNDLLLQGITQEGPDLHLRLPENQQLIDFGIDRHFMKCQMLTQEILNTQPDLELTKLQAEVAIALETNNLQITNFTFNCTILEGYIKQTMQALELLGQAFTLSGFCNDVIWRESNYHQRQEQTLKRQQEQQRKEAILEKLIKEIPLDDKGREIWRTKVIQPIMDIARISHTMKTSRSSVSLPSMRRLTNSQETIKLLRKNITSRITDPSLADELNKALDTCSNFADDLQTQHQQKPIPSTLSLDTARELLKKHLDALMDDIKNVLGKEAQTTFLVEWNQQTASSSTDLIKVSKIFNNLQFFDFCQHITSEKIMESKIIDNKKFGELMLVTIAGTGQPVYAKKLHKELNKEVILLPTRINDSDNSLCLNLAHALFDYHSARAAGYLQMQRILSKFTHDNLYLPLTGNSTGKAVSKYELKQRIVHYFAQFVCFMSSGTLPQDTNPDAFKQFSRWLITNMPKKLIVAAPYRHDFYELSYAGRQKRLDKIEKMLGEKLLEARAFLPLLYATKAEKMSKHNRGAKDPTSRQDLLRSIHNTFVNLKKLSSTHLNATRENGRRNMFKEACDIYDKLCQAGDSVNYSLIMDVIHSLQLFFKTPNKDAENFFSIQYPEMVVRSLDFEIEKYECVCSDIQVHPDSLNLMGLHSLQNDDFYAAYHYLTLLITALETDRVRQYQISETRNTAVFRSSSNPKTQPVTSKPAENTTKFYHDDFVYYNTAICCLHLGKNTEAHQHLTTFNTLMGKEKNLLFTALAAKANELTITGKPEQALALLGKDKALILDEIL